MQDILSKVSHEQQYTLQNISSEAPLRTTLRDEIFYPYKCEGTKFLYNFAFLQTIVETEAKQKFVCAAECYKKNSTFNVLHIFVY